MTSIRLRPIIFEQDISRFTALLNQAHAEPITDALLRDREDKEPVGMIRQRLGAEDSAGLLVGIGEADRGPWEPPGQWYLRVIVDTAHRNVGIGTRLYEAVLQFVREQGGTKVKGYVRENNPTDLQFAQRRGFCVDRHLFESTLALATFDETRFAGVVETVQAGGIRFFSFADIEETVEARRKFYELNDVIVWDIPGWDQPPLPFEDFERSFFGGSTYRPDGVIVAADEHDWIGFAVHGYMQPTNSMYNVMTGVTRDYRGRKVALALKLLGIACARRYGAVYLRTNNDSENKPMLAINQQLGYKPEPGIYTLTLMLE